MVDVLCMVVEVASRKGLHWTHRMVELHAQVVVAAVVPHRTALGHSEIPMV